MEKMQRRPEIEQQEPDSKKPKLEMEDKKEYIDTEGKPRAERLKIFIENCLQRQKETFDCTDEIDETGRHDMTFEESASYQLDILESEGFDLGDYSKVSPVPGWIFRYYDPPAKTPSDLASLTHYAQLAIKEFNTRESKLYDNVFVLKANATVVQGFIYYITFKATEKEQGNTETFQAIVYVGIPTTNIEIDMVRIKIPLQHIRISREGKHLDPVSTSISAV